MNKLHCRYLIWKLKRLGYDISPTRSSSSHRVIYIQTHKKGTMNITTSDYKNLFRLYFIKYMCMYENVNDEMVVRLE